MVTPTTEQIREEALRLFYQDNPLATTPEDEELKESSYWLSAQQDLMRGESAEALAYLDQLANDVGRRVVTEEEHNKLLDLERKLEKVKEREEKLEIIKSDLEALKGSLDAKPQPQVIERVVQIIREKKPRKVREEKIRLRKPEPFKVKRVVPKLPLMPSMPEMPEF